MAPPQRFRVLRCCSCRLFQAHQEKKSLKWTCKACGEKQSFLRSISKFCPLCFEDAPRLTTCYYSGLSHTAVCSNFLPAPQLLPDSLPSAPQPEVLLNCVRGQATLPSLPAESLASQAVGVPTYSGIESKHIYTRTLSEHSHVFVTYGEGSGADCRRHVQKLNLLQGQISEMSLRSLEEPVPLGEEENAGPGQAERESVQEKPQSSESRWLRYLERDSKEPGMEGGVCFERPSLSRTEKPEPPFNTGLPRKRTWSQSTVQPPHSPEVQNLGDSEVTLEPQKDRTGLARKVKEGGSYKDWGTGELSFPQGDPPRPAPQVRATSAKWERFLLPHGDGPHVDVEPPVPLQRDPKPAGAALAEQGTLHVQTPREGRPGRLLAAPKLPWPARSLKSESQRSCMKPPGQPRDTGPLAKGRPLVTGVQEPPLVRLCDLFKTGEDFEDDL